MSHRPTYRPTCGFQFVVRNATDVWLATQSKTEKSKNATHTTDSICVCIALRTAAWKLIFKSVFISLRALSKLSHATHAMQRTHVRLVMQSKNKNTQCMHAKNTTQAINSILCVHCVLLVRALHLLRCV